MSFRDLLSHVPARKGCSPCHPLPTPPPHTCRGQQPIASTPAQSPPPTRHCVHLQVLLSPQGTALGNMSS